MGLSNSLTNAFSGLTITSRAAQLVSSNLANAMNENYARQEIEIFQSNNGGALTSQAERFVDKALVTDRRAAKADLSSATEGLKTAQVFEQVLGRPDDLSSIVGSLANFNSALQFLESNPGSTVRQLEGVSSAKAMIDRLSSAEHKIQNERISAEQRILTAVMGLNQSLQQIVELNEKIFADKINGRNPNALLDQRQALIDQVGELVPVRLMHGANDAISLFTHNGILLADTKSAKFEFTKTNLIMPHMSIEGGELSALSLNGYVVDMTSVANSFSGGGLQALFRTRDEDSVKAQDLIDNLAFDLAERFQDLPSDMTTTTSLPGLFTDAGARVDTSQQMGLAGRLTINVGVDPALGGESWRLYSGLNSVTQAPAGDATIISNMLEAVSDNSSPFGSLFEHVATIASQAALDSSTYEREHSFANAQFDHLNQMHLSNGVNTDFEIQKLLLIEKNYAANAKVMTTIDEMFDIIMRIG